MPADSKVIGNDTRRRHARDEDLAAAMVALAEMMPHGQSLLVCDPSEFLWQVARHMDELRERCGEKHGE